MNMGEKIKSLRKEKGLKQSELADKAGISRVAIGNYERNERRPTIDIIQRIADALNVSINYLIECKSEEERQGEIKKEIEFEKYTEEIALALEIENNDMCINANLKMICKAAELPNEAISELRLFIDFIKYKYNASCQHTKGAETNAKKEEY